MRVSVNILNRNGSAGKTCEAFAKGIARSGDEAVKRTDKDHNMQGFDAAVLWGYVTTCQNVIKSCKDKGIPWVFLDMGYWQRADHFKVAVNERHGTAYFMDKPKPPDRFKKFRISVKPWRKKGGNILLAGMSAKAAWSWGLQNEEYEKNTVYQLQRLTAREIIYRPKPNFVEAQPISGSKMDRHTPVEVALLRAHCVIAHHSNLACDALLEGVPVLCKYGLASVLAPYDLTSVEHPFYPEGREQWAYNAAYCNWSLEEMASGKCWGFLKEEGLIK